MKIEGVQSKLYTFISFIAVILILAGVYGILRTGINMVVYKNYPAVPIFTMNFSGITPYTTREEDCMYPQTYMTPDGKPRPATVEEKNNESLQQKLCLSGVRDARENAKANDLSTSLLALFLGVGMLLTRRFIFSKHIL